MTEKKKTLAGKRIGVFGKGGCGKSTAVVLLARALKDRGYEICVLDADSTNIGLDQALGLDKFPESLIDYFGGMVFSGGAVTCPVWTKQAFVPTVPKERRLFGHGSTKPVPR